MQLCYDIVLLVEFSQRRILLRNLNTHLFQIFGLTLNKTYLADYANDSSKEFRELAIEIESEMLATLQKANETSNFSIIGVKVTALRNGTVLADMIVGSKAENLSASSVKRGVDDGITNGDLAALNATGTVEVQGINSL